MFFFSAFLSWRLKKNQTKIVALLSSQCSGPFSNFIYIAYSHLWIYVHIRDSRIIFKKKIFACKRSFFSRWRSLHYGAISSGAEFVSVDRLLYTHTWGWNGPKSHRNISAIVSIIRSIDICKKKTKQKLKKVIPARENYSNERWISTQRHLTKITSTFEHR